MSIRSWVLHLFCLGLLSHALANPVCSHMGARTVCGEGTLSELDVAGKATLEGTTVTGDSHVAGMLNTGHAHLNSLKISGKAFIDSTQVSGLTKISGILEACHSQFKQKVTIASDRTHLSGSTMGDIEIIPGGDTQVLCVGNRSIVNGNIVFTGNHGHVLVDANSKINGQIIGGDVNQKNFSTYCEGDETC